MLDTLFTHLGDQAPRIAEGFPGQLAAVFLPRPVIASWLNAAAST